MQNSRPLAQRIYIGAQVAFWLLMMPIGVLLTVVLGTDGVVEKFSEEMPAELVQARQLKPAPAPDDSLRVLNWNLKFGGARIDFFFDCYGNRVHMDSAEVLHNLAQAAKAIRSLNPDIVLIQEVDRGSKRVAGIDQVQWLLDHTHLNHAAYASQWNAWIPKYGLGRVNSGNAVLSRWPLDSAVRHALPQVAAQDYLTRLFYLRRNVLETRVQLPGQQPLWVLATHLEAYCMDSTRWHQLAILQRLAARRAAQGAVIVGGDLNTLPPGTKKQKGFDDSACPADGFVMDDYTAEATWLQPFYDKYAEAIPLAAYQANEARYYSHTVNGKGWWNRRLDYLFTNGRWTQGAVLQDSLPNGQRTFPLSDHAPLVGVWHRR